MNKLLTGLVFALMLTGCGTQWTNADIRMALDYCEAHNGLKRIDGIVVRCNDGKDEWRDHAYKKVYKKDNP